MDSVERVERVVWGGLRVGLFVGRADGRGEEVFGGGCSLSREEVRIGAGRRLVLGGLVLGGLVLGGLVLGEKGEKGAKRWRDVAPLETLGKKERRSYLCTDRGRFGGLATFSRSR
jgi:hypothetical protein